METLRDARIMSIYTGLSRTVAGHMIELDRDENKNRAKIVVKCVSSRATVTDVELSAIKVGASLLASQSRRFFGIGWIVEDWDGSGVTLTAREKAS
jgi:hypothetical protein